MTDIKNIPEFMKELKAYTDLTEPLYQSYLKTLTKV